MYLSIRIFFSFLKYGLKYAGVLQRKSKRSKQQAAVHAPSQMVFPHNEAVDKATHKKGKRKSSSTSTAKKSKGSTTTTSTTVSTSSR
jgi:hypothetical protein